MSAAYCGGFDFSGGQNGLQKGRKNIYIPRKEENRKCWGESTDYRREMDERNRRIYEDYLSGMKTDTLSMKYFLSEKSIQRIIAKEKKRPA